MKKGENEKEFEIITREIFGWRQSIILNGDDATFKGTYSIYLRKLAR